MRASSKPSLLLVFYEDSRNGRKLPPEGNSFKIPAVSAERHSYKGVTGMQPSGIHRCTKFVSGQIRQLKLSGPSRCGMQEKQFASKRLVRNLVAQEKYELAAYVVLGARSVFEMYSKLISETVSKSRDVAETVRRNELENVIELAKEEIKDHRRWQEEVLSCLPRKDEALGLTGTLRLAFADVSDARKKLLQQVMLAHGEMDQQCGSSCADANLQAVT